MIGGLKDNDIILEIDNNKVESIMDVSKFITTSTETLLILKLKDLIKSTYLKLNPI